MLSDPHDHFVHRSHFGERSKCNFGCVFVTSPVIKAMELSHNCRKIQLNYQKCSFYTVKHHRSTVHYNYIEFFRFRSIKRVRSLHTFNLSRFHFDFVCHSLWLCISLCFCFCLILYLVLTLCISLSLSVSQVTAIEYLAVTICVPFRYHCIFGSLIAFPDDYLELSTNNDYFGCASHLAWHFLWEIVFCIGWKCESI